MIQNIQGKTALITGGTKGIGYGIAECLLREGMNVVITGRTKEGVQEAVSALERIGIGQVAGAVADVRQLKEQEEVVQLALSRFGRLDAVIANAGVGHFGSILSLTESQWHETLDTNLTGVFYTVKAALPALTASRGYLITIASLAGTNFFEGGSAYNASKFGLVGFTQAVMMDVRKLGIKVTTIMPGSVATHFNNHVPSEADAWKIQPEDIGQITVDLLKMHPRTLPSKIEVRPSMPPGK